MFLSQNREKNGVKMSQEISVCLSHEIFEKSVRLDFYADNYLVTMIKANKGHISSVHVKSFKYIWVNSWFNELTHIYEKAHIWGLIIYIFLKTLAARPIEEW